MEIKIKWMVLVDNKNNPIGGMELDEPVGVEEEEIEGSRTLYTPLIPAKMQQAMNNLAAIRFDVWLAKEWWAILPDELCSENEYDELPRTEPWESA